MIYNTLSKLTNTLFIVVERQILAIGGGGFGKKNSHFLIENYLLNLSKKESPRICFIPTATGDDTDYIVRFYSVFTKLSCQPSHIELFKRTVNLEEHILNQDIIFVGGGNTKSMLAVWNDWGINHFLRMAYDNGIIMSGVSAGAICWFSSGITDSWDKELNIIPCLGFIRGTCCPHYDEEPARIPYVKNMLSKKTINNCIAIEGGSALYCVNDIPINNISFYNHKRSYLVHSELNKFTEKPFQNIQL